MDYNAKYNKYLEKLDNYFEKIFPKNGNKKLNDCMRYSFFAGGKRVRPVLMLALGESLGVSDSDLLPFATSCELIHTYSLIHDDLPPLDNDDYRRGKLSNHKVFGEDFAIIGGDGLLNFAYELALNNCDNMTKVKALTFLSKMAGFSGMIGGQAYDLEHIGDDEKSLLKIDEGKTACMITAPLVMAGILANVDTKYIQEFGYNLGLLFQYTDDLLDVVGDSKKMGKTLGKDVLEDKLTAVKIFGLDGVKNKINELKNNCLDLIKKFNGGEFLSVFVEELASRNN